MLVAWRFVVNTAKNAINHAQLPPKTAGAEWGTFRKKANFTIAFEQNFATILFWSVFCDPPPARPISHVLDLCVTNIVYTSISYNMHIHATLKNESVNCYLLIV